MKNHIWLFDGISYPTKKILIPGIENPRDTPKIKNPESWGYPEKINSDPGDFEIFRIFHSEFFREFQISIPIPGISGLSEFFDLARNKKSHPETNSDEKYTVN